MDKRKEALESYIKQCRAFAEVLDEDGLDRDGLHIAIYRVCEAAEGAENKADNLRTQPDPRVLVEALEEIMTESTTAEAMISPAYTLGNILFKVNEALRAWKGGAR